MQKNISALLFMLAISSITAHLTGAPLEFMSRNVRRLGSDAPEHQWDNRKQLIFEPRLTRPSTSTDLTLGGWGNEVFERWGRHLRAS